MSHALNAGDVLAASIRWSSRISTAPMPRWPPPSPNARGVGHFERQRTLLAGGFTTRASFDQAQQGLRTAEGSLEAQRRSLALQGRIELYRVARQRRRFITARNLEVGQVAQAAQSAFTWRRTGRAMPCLMSTNRCCSGSRKAMSFI